MRLSRIRPSFLIVLIVVSRLPFFYGRLFIAGAFRAVLIAVTFCRAADTAAFFRGIVLLAGIKPPRVISIICAL
jgi:hypothetical protein